MVSRFPLKSYPKLLREMKSLKLKVGDMPIDVAESVLELHMAFLNAWQEKKERRKHEEEKNQAEA